MRRTLAVVMLVAAAGLGQLALANQKETTGAKDDSAFLGTWSGTWSGGSAGRFEMTISRDANGKLSGSITPSPENGAPYTSSFQSLVVENGKLTARFQPPDGQVGVSMTATVEGAECKGSYDVYEKSNGSGVESGSWAAKKR
jgi:hypothetical protein